MTRWIHRILKSAQNAGCIHSYTCGYVFLSPTPTSFPCTLFPKRYNLRATLFALDAYRSLAPLVGALLHMPKWGFQVSDPLPAHPLS